MEVKCYLKATRKKNIKKTFINKNLPALFPVLLLTRQFEKAGVIPFFIHTPKGGLLEIPYASEFYLKVFPLGYANPLWF